MGPKKRTTTNNPVDEILTEDITEQQDGQPQTTTDSTTEQQGTAGSQSRQQQTSSTNTTNRRLGSEYDNIIETIDERNREIDDDRQETGSPTGTAMRIQDNMMIFFSDMMDQMQDMRREIREIREEYRRADLTPERVQRIQDQVEVGGRQNIQQRRNQEQRNQEQRDQRNQERRDQEIRDRTPEQQQRRNDQFMERFRQMRATNSETPRIPDNKLFRDTRALVRDYDGQSTPFTTWLQDIKMAMEYGNELSDHQKKVIVYGRLTGDAREMAGSSLSPAEPENHAARAATFEEFVRMIEDRVDPTQNKQQTKTEFEMRIQHGDEPLDAYLRDKQKLWERIYKYGEHKDIPYLHEFIIRGMINNKLKKKARSARIEPPTDTEKLFKYILEEAAIIQDQLRAGEITADKAIGTAVRKQKVTYLAYKSQANTTINQLNYAENDETNFVKSGQYFKTNKGQTISQGQSASSYNPKPKFGQKKTFYKRLRNQNTGSKGRCYWCGNKEHFIRDCPRKAAGLDRTINGINCQQSYEEAGLLIDEEGYICALQIGTQEIETDRDQFETENETEGEIQAIGQHRYQSNNFRNNNNFRQNYNKNKKKGSFFKTRKMRTMRNNRVHEVMVISHYDDDGHFLYEEQLEKEPNHDSQEIQEVDLEEIFENNYSINMIGMENEEFDDDMIANLRQLNKEEEMTESGERFEKYF